jgi:hypothetical protein
VDPGQCRSHHGHARILRRLTRVGRLRLGPSLWCGAHYVYFASVSAASAIPDLDTLKSTVSDWLDRDDLDTKIPTFILMAEALFNRELRTPDMEKTTTGQGPAKTRRCPTITARCGRSTKRAVPTVR